MQKPAKRRASTKALRRQAEVAAEHFAVERLKCVVIRRAVRTQWQKVDFFGADVLGKQESGDHIYIQVTTGASGCVSERRKKLVAIPWHTSDTVLLLNLVATASAAKGRRTEYWFRVEQFDSIAGPRAWSDWPETIFVPRYWFKKGDRDD